MIPGNNFFGEDLTSNVKLNFPFHDYQISVKRLCVALVILPSLSMLSHTLQKTSNFCSLVRVSEYSQFFMILIMYALLVIIFVRGVVDALIQDVPVVQTQDLVSSKSLPNLLVSLLHL